MNKVPQKTSKLEWDKFSAEGEQSGVLTWLSNQGGYKITF